MSKLVLAAIVVGLSVSGSPQGDVADFYIANGSNGFASQITVDYTVTETIRKTDEAKEWTAEKANRIENSHAVVLSKSYKDVWFREYETYLPKFTDEIRYAGGEKIKRYYEDLAEKEEKAMELFMAGWEYETWSLYPYLDEYLYWYNDYVVDYAGPYLSVRYISAYYGGGVHGNHPEKADNFDMRTGDLLTAEKVFSNTPASRKMLSSLINKELEKGDTEIFEEVAVEDVSDLKFQIDKEGINIFFNEYEIAPFAAGVINVTIPYEKLGDVLKIDLESSILSANKS